MNDRLKGKRVPLALAAWPFQCEFELCATPKAEVGGFGSLHGAGPKTDLAGGTVRYFDVIEELQHARDSGVVVALRSWTYHSFVGRFPLADPRSDRYDFTCDMVTWREVRMRWADSAF